MGYTKGGKHVIHKKLSYSKLCCQISIDLETTPENVHIIARFVIIIICFVFSFSLFVCLVAVSSVLFLERVVFFFK